MSFTALEFTRKPGDLIQSEDWNNVMKEIEGTSRKVEGISSATAGTLSVDRKLELGPEHNKLLIDADRDDELSIKTERKAHKLILGNGEENALTIRGNRVGIGMDDPSEMLEVDGHVKAEPVIGQWYPKAHGPAQSGHRLMILDHEVYNNDSYFEQRGNQRITIKVSGYYQISVRVLINIYWGGSYCHSYLRKNNENITDGTILDMDHGHYYYPRGNTDSWDDRHNEYAGYFEAGDFISVNVYKNHVSGYSYHNGPYYSRLTITKLN